MLNSITDELNILALELMNGNQYEASRWMDSPINILNGKTPREYTVDKKSLEDVIDLVGRIRHGIFS